MVRKLKFHEKKLLRKVDFISWPEDKNLSEVKAMKLFHIQRREDYSMFQGNSCPSCEEISNGLGSITMYNKLGRQIRALAEKIRELDERDPFRVQATTQLLEKLYAMGLISNKKSLHIADKVNAYSFCRRRLPVMMVSRKMSENLKAAVTFIEQGHIRVGPEVVTDPAFLVTRNMEDFLTWTHASAIRRQVLQYNDMCDDYDMMN